MGQEINRYMCVVCKRSFNERWFIEYIKSQELDYLYDIVDRFREFGSVDKGDYTMISLELFIKKLEEEVANIRHIYEYALEHRRR